MFLFVALLGLITLICLRPRRSDEDILCKKDTTVINGIFVICIMLSHSTQYLHLEASRLTGWYRHFQGFHNQWVVVTFLAFSGFGVMAQIAKGGKTYVKKFPKNRLLKTLLNFDIAILLYLLVNACLGIPKTPLAIAGSFIGLTAVGNSNWYIFAILVMYVLSYCGARWFADSPLRQAIFVTEGTVAYIAVMQLTGMPSRFFSTILCYPLGVWMFLFKDKLIALFRHGKWLSVLSLLTLLAVLYGTYHMRDNDYLMNIASCAFVLATVWFSMFFEIKSRVLLFIGKHAFSIYILQRLPMLTLEHFGLLTDQPLLFVPLCLAITLIMAVIFDLLIGKLNKKLFA